MNAYFLYATNELLYTTIRYVRDHVLHSIRQLLDPRVHPTIEELQANYFFRTW